MSNWTDTINKQLSKTTTFNTHFLLAIISIFYSWYFSVTISSSTDWRIALYVFLSFSVAFIILGIRQVYLGYRNYWQTVFFEASLAITLFALSILSNRLGMAIILLVIWLFLIGFAWLSLKLIFKTKYASASYTASAICLIASIFAFGELLIYQYARIADAYPNLTTVYAGLGFSLMVIIPSVTIHFISSGLFKNSRT